MKNVTPEEFVELWQSSESLSQVCQKIKQNKNTAVTRAARYRKLGIELKRFSRAAVNIESLKKIAISSLKKP